MISNVYIAKCCDYEADVIYRHIHRFFQNFGGIAQYIKPGMNVLIKPNLCLAHPPGKAITTHPMILEQIVRVLMEEGAAVTIGDNPIGKVEKKTIEKIWKIAGIDEVAEKTGCRKILLDELALRKKTFRLNEKSFSYFISKEYLNADFVINVPKFKSHALLGFSGAIKNIYGIVPGRAKVQLHGFAPSLENFARVIVDIYSMRPPELTVMDAIEGLEGNGPGVSGKKREIGVLMISSDGLLIDSISARMMGLKPEDLLINAEAAQRKLGSLEPDNICIQGFEQLPDCFAKDFEMPDTLQLRDSKVIKKLFEFAKFNIRINPDKCTGCMLCVENCPIQCIRTIHKPCLDKSACIQCLCCLELCPNGAVEVIKNKFYKDLKRIKDRKKKVSIKYEESKSEKYSQK